MLEDGKPQKIAAFAAVEVPAPPPPTAPWMRSVAPDVRTNADVKSPEGRLFVILLDDALIPFDPFAIKSAKDIARKVIDQIGPADRVAVVFSAGSAGTQNFTNDRARLLAAVETLNPRYARYTHGLGGRAAVDRRRPVAARCRIAPQIDPDTLFKAGSMRTLRSVAETLISAPERRKILVFVSPGITVDVESASTPVSRRVVRGARGAPPMALKEANAVLFKEMPELFRRMQLANVTIYPIDPVRARRTRTVRAAPDVFTSGAARHRRAASTGI